MGKESDIYAVAAEGGEKRILKLQRSVIQFGSDGRTVGLIGVVLKPQTGTYIFSSHQVQARLSGEAQVCFMDVHESVGGAEGVCVHEGASALWFSRI